jgi:hypothetical protein
MAEFIQEFNFTQTHTHSLKNKPSLPSYTLTITHTTHILSLSLSLSLSYLVDWNIEGCEVVQSGNRDRRSSGETACIYMHTHKYISHADERKIRLYNGINTNFSFINSSILL